MTIVEGIDATRGQEALVAHGDHSTNTAEESSGKENDFHCTADIISQRQIPRQAHLAGSYSKTECERMESLCLYHR